MSNIHPPPHPGNKAQSPSWPEEPKKARVSRIPLRATGKSLTKILRYQKSKRNTAEVETEHLRG